MPAPLGASVPAQLLAVLADGTPRSREQLAQALRVSLRQVSAALAALRREGQVAIVGYEGTYTLRWGQRRPALWGRTGPGERKSPQEPIGT